jgi:hypothetical protein
MDAGSVAEVVGGIGIENTVYEVPSWEKVNDIRKAKASPKMLKAIQETCIDLFQHVMTSKEGEIFQSGMNPRRIEQWKNIIFYSTILATGEAEPGSIPTEALVGLKYAYPVSNETEYAQWVNLVQDIFHPAESAIATIVANAYGEMTKVVEAAHDPDERQAALIRMGEIIANAQQDLKRFGDNTMVKQALADLHNAFAKLSRGEEL